MRIDGTYRPQTPGQKPLSEAADAAKGPQVPTSPAGTSSSESAQSAGPAANSLAPYVEKVRNTPEVDAGAVAEARRLLEAGQLDTPEAVQRAAQAMVDQGI